MQLHGRPYGSYCRSKHNFTACCVLERERERERDKERDRERETERETERERERERETDLI